MSLEPIPEELKDFADETGAAITETDVAGNVYDTYDGKPPDSN